MATTRVESQRARLLDAMGHVVAERGYANATVADVVRAAGVSRSTFYEQFPSKEACFLEAFRVTTDALEERVRAAVHAAEGAGWRVQLRAGIRGYLAALAARPDVARTYLVEIQSAGSEALSARDVALRRFAGRYAASYEQARADDPTLTPPHPDALLALCAGTEQLCAERLRTAGAAALPGLEDVFCACAEALLTHHEED